MMEPEVCRRRDCEHCPVSGLADRYHHQRGNSVVKKDQPDFDAASQKEGNVMRHMKHIFKWKVSSRERVSIWILTMTRLANMTEYEFRERKKEALKKCV